LKALEALCSANYFVDGSKIDGNLEIVLQSILANMRYNQGMDSANAKYPILTSTEGIMLTHDGKRPSIADQLITENELSQTAENCLTALFDNTSASTLKTLFTTILKLLDDAKHLDSSQYLLEILPIVISNSQTQYHFVIISAVLEKLNSESRPRPKTTFVHGLSFLISSGNLAGVTIPELLETCAKHMKLTASSQELESSLKHPLLRSLINAIGSLASYLAYPEQINEIVSFLVNRIQTADLNTASPDTTFSVCILEALVAVVSKSGTPKKRISIQPSVLSFGLLSPLAYLLQSPTSGIRFAVYNLFSRVLITGRMDHGPNEAKEEFCDAIRHSLYALLLHHDAIPADFVLCGNLLISILALHSFKELGIVIPMLFHLSERYFRPEETGVSESAKRAMASLIVEYFLNASEFLNLSQLNKYLKDIKASRLESNQWSPGIELTDDAFNALHARHFSETEAGMILNPVEDRIRRIKVIELTSNDMSKDNAEELKLLDIAWTKEYVSEGLTESISKLNQLALVEKKLHKKPLHHKRSVSAKSTSSKNEAPATRISISDFKEALNHKPATIQSILDDDTAPHVSDLLKSISDTFGYFQLT
jgi:hypothetical protein